jgi:hypothetical protein
VPSLFLKFNFVPLIGAGASLVSNVIQNGQDWKSGEVPARKVWR